MDFFAILFFILIFYICILLIFRILGVWRKKKYGNCNNSCPDCTNPLNRVSRKKIDYIFYHITFRIFNFKRYNCNECGWDGLRWESPYTSS